MSQEDLIKKAVTAAEQDDLASLMTLIPALEDGVNTTVPDDNGTLMHVAARHNSLKVAIYLHLQDSNLLDTSNDNGEDPNDIAKKDTFYETVEEQAELFDNICNFAGRDHDHLKVRRLYEGALFDINTADSCGTTLLHAASEHGNTDTMAWLIEQGADIHARNDNRRTPLHEAAYNNHAQAIILLLNHGARALDIDDRGKTPYLYTNSGTRAEDILQEAEKAENTKPWARMGDDCIAHTRVSFASGQKLTEIFNFSAREKITIVKTLGSSNETAFPPKSFDEFPEQHIRTAFTAFQQAGGTADENFVFHARSRLNKPSRLPDKPAN